jgi:hypothetical protein
VLTRRLPLSITGAGSDESNCAQLWKRSSTISVGHPRRQVAAGSMAHAFTTTRCDHRRCRVTGRLGEAEHTHLMFGCDRASGRRISPTAQMLWSPSDTRTNCDRTKTSDLTPLQHDSGSGPETGRPTRSTKERSRPIARQELGCHRRHGLHKQQAGQLSPDNADGSLDRRAARVA